MNDASLMYVTLTFGLEDGEVEGYEFFPGVHPYASTPEFWYSVALFASDMADTLPPGPVEPEEGDIVW